jgi:hypothetical protein
MKNSIISTSGQIEVHVHGYSQKKVHDHGFEGANYKTMLLLSYYY